MASYRPLAEVGLQDLGECGGKAAHLGEALRLGCPVPEGIVLSTELYRRFMRQGGLQGEIASILATLQPQAIAHFQAAEWAIQEAFRVRRMPTEVVRTITEAWHTLGAGPVAVRSSAVRENAAQHGFVGQHATTLAVADEKALLEAVLGCWMSLFGAKALAYAYHFGINLLDGESGAAAMAVLLQRMIMPTFQGGLFTVDPLTGNPDVFVLEVHSGPDAGVHLLEPYAPSAAEPAYRARLRALGLLLDEHMSAYQALEWAVVDEQVYLLRVRPATGIPPFLPATAPAEQVAPEFGPLELVCPATVSPRVLRPYSWYHRSRSPRLLDAYFRRVSPLFNLNTGRDELYLWGYLYRRWHRSPFPAYDARMASVSRWLHSLRRLWAARTLDREYRQVWRAGRPRLEALNQVEFRQSANRELAAALREVMALNEAFLERAGHVGDSYQALVDTLQRLTRLWLGDDTPCQALFKPPDDARQAHDRALREQASRNVQAAAREAAFQAFLHRFRQIYGRGQPWNDGRDLCNLQVDEGAARQAWAAALRMATGPRLDATADSRSTCAALELDLLKRLNGLQRVVYRSVLRSVRRYAHTEVDRDGPAWLAWLVEGDIVHELGRRLQIGGLAAQADEATSLGYQEVLDWLEGRMPREMLTHTLQARRQLLRRWARYAPPPILGEQHPQPPPALRLPTEADATWRGLGVSAGTAQGRARVITSLGQAVNILPGEVLVLRAPLFELTPWFGVAAAVVAEGGWLLDDAAVLAREYGVPAVFRVPEVTQRLHDGDQLQVDATRGVVARHTPEPDWEAL